MKNLKFFFLCAAIAWSCPGLAAKIECGLNELAPFGGPTPLFSWNSKTSEVIFESEKPRTDGPFEWVATRDQMTQVSLLNKDEKELARLEVSGSIIDPKAEFIIIDASKETRLSCEISGDAPELFDALILRPALVSANAPNKGSPARVQVYDPQAALYAWKAWVSKRPKPCDEEFDSIAYLQLKPSTKVALVLHGFSSSPRRMGALIESLYQKGYHVLAPRLTGHYNKRLEDLDNAKATQWITDAEETFQIAKMLGPQVTVIGYSLGGALASRLMLLHGNEIDRGILLAPAWRFTNSVALGSLIGDAFNISYNKFTNTPITCDVKNGYTSAPAGLQVPKVTFATELSLGLRKNTPDPWPMIYNRIRVPHLIFTTPKDEVIHSVVVTPVCQSNDLFCTHVSVPNREHTTVQLDLNQKAEGAFVGKSMEKILKTFLNLKFDDPRYPFIIEPQEVTE